MLSIRSSTLLYKHCIPALCTLIQSHNIKYLRSVPFSYQHSNIKLHNTRYFTTHSKQPDDDENQQHNHTDNSPNVNNTDNPVDSGPSSDSTSTDNDTLRSSQLVNGEIVEPTVQRRTLLQQRDVAARYNEAIRRLDNIHGYGIDLPLKQYLARQSAAGWLTLDSIVNRRPRLHQPHDPFTENELAELLSQTDKYKSRVRSFAFYRRLGFNPLDVDNEQDLDDDEDDVDEKLFSDMAVPVDDDNVALVDPYHGYILPRNEDINDHGPIGARQFGMHTKYEPIDISEDKHMGKYDIRDKGLKRHGSWAREVKQFGDRISNTQKKYNLYVERSTSTLQSTNPTLHDQLISALKLINSQTRIYTALISDITAIVNEHTPNAASTQHRSLIGKLRALTRYLQDRYKSNKREQRLASRDALIAAIFLRKPLGELCHDAVYRVGIDESHYQQLFDKYKNIYGIDIAVESYVGERQTSLRVLLRALAHPYLTHQQTTSILQSLDEMCTNQQNQSTSVFRQLQKLYNESQHSNDQEQARRLIMSAFRLGDQLLKKQTSSSVAVNITADTSDTTSTNIDQQQHGHQSSQSRSAAAIEFDRLLNDEQNIVVNEIMADVEPSEFRFTASKFASSNGATEFTESNESSTSLFDNVKHDYDAEFSNKSYEQRYLRSREREASFHDLSPAHDEESHAFDHAYFHTDQADWAMRHRLSPAEYPADQGPRKFSEDDEIEQLTDEVQELMYALHMHQPDKYHERTLARMFGVSNITAKSTLLSQATVRHYRSMGFPTTDAELQSQVFPPADERIDDSPDYEDWENHPEAWELMGVGDGTEEDMVAIENAGDRLSVETSIKYDNPRDYMGTAISNPPIPIDDEQLADAYIMSQQRLKRFWTRGEHLDQQESELRKEIGYIGAPPKLIVPKKLDAQILPPTHHNLLMLNITDTPNARYQIAVRDKNGILREANAEEFNSVRYAERSAKSKFEYLKYKSPKVKQQQA